MNRIIFRDLLSVSNAVNKFCTNHLREEGTIKFAKDFNKIGEKMQQFFNHINIAEMHEEFNWELIGKALAPEVTADADLQKRVNKALAGLKAEIKEKEQKVKQHRFRGSSAGNGATRGGNDLKSSRHQPYPSSNTSWSASCSTVCYNCEKMGHYSRDCKAPKKEK